MKMMQKMSRRRLWKLIPFEKPQGRKKQQGERRRKRNHPGPQLYLNLSKILFIISSINLRRKTMQQQQQQGLTLTLVVPTEVQALALCSQNLLVQQQLDHRHHLRRKRAGTVAEQVQGNSSSRPQLRALGMLRSLITCKACQISTQHLIISRKYMWDMMKLKK